MFQYILKTLFREGFFLVILTLFVGCSSERSFSDIKIHEIDPGSYNRHMNSLIDDYLTDSKKKEVRVDQDTIHYLDGIVQSIRINNELFFKRNIKIQFIFLASNIPFYFSTPDGRIILSSGLIKKYIKTEELFSAILTSELVRIEKNLYRAQRLIPNAANDINTIVGMYKLNFEENIELYKWVYILLRRSGRDGIAVLNILQTKNKNVLDFALMVDDGQLLSNLERRFKSFLVTNENIGTLAKYSNVQNKKYSKFMGQMELQ